MFNNTPALAPLFLLAFTTLVTAGPSSTSLPFPVPSASSAPTLSAVCTPSSCIIGNNSLTAGVQTVSSINGSAVDLTLLPGTYSSTSAVTANSTLLNFVPATTFSPSAGFLESGVVESNIIVTLSSGLTTYSAPLYQGIAMFSSINSTFLNSSISAPISSFLLSPDTFAIVQLATQRLVVWNSIADVGQLQNGNGSVTIGGVQSAGCTIPCASGGSCTGNSVCLCAPGFTGSTCNACLPGFFGPTCAPCASSCGVCDAGITGTGRCLVAVAPPPTAAVCNCVNGICASGSSSSSCACSAGWSKATNGTQCAVCATGYFSSPSGDCLACDPSCSTCAGPSGACLTCQVGLGATFDPTRCGAVASLSSASNTTTSASSTFVTCPTGSFFDSAASTCSACSPLCSSCFNGAATGCLACKAPYGLLAGVCVSVDQKSGICNSGGATSGGTTGAYILDNVKGVCDAAPAKCTRASIDNFSIISTRSQLSCSACLAGAYLSNGICVATCPVGTFASGTACVACDASCSSCSGSASYCTSCPASSLALNGACIAGPSCPIGFFVTSINSTSNSTSTTSSTSQGYSCLACHPDCATCSGTFDTCRSCPSSRPVKSTSSTCILTCSSSQYFDAPSGVCKSCSSGCATCSGGTDSQCLSCSSTTTLTAGACLTAKCPTVVPGFCVCLSQLVNVTAPLSATGGKIFPWYFILLIILLVLLFLAGIILFCRRKHQLRRNQTTQKFASELDQKVIDMKLRTLPHHQQEFYPQPRSIPTSPITPNGYFSEIPLRRSGEIISLGPTLTREEEKARSAKKLEEQITGASCYTTYTSASCDEHGRQWASNNPFSHATNFSTGR